MPSYINFEITALLPSCHYLHDISAESPGRVFTKEQIYSAGWNDDYAVDDNAIRVMISKLREKTGVGYIETIRGLGYRLVRGERK